MNMRGSGDGEALCPLLYNAGLDTDLLAALSALSSLVPRIGVVAFSLGANLALLMLGRRREHLPPALAGVAAVCPPLDLSACADALEARGNGLYQHYFMQMLAESYRRRHRARPDLFAEGRERGLRTVREYDDRITAPFGGYESAAQYYERSSAGPWLASIDRPALVLAAADDPMIPRAVGGRLAALPVGAPRDRADRRPRRLRRPARKPPAGSGPRTARSTSWSPPCHSESSLAGRRGIRRPPADSSDRSRSSDDEPYGAGVRTGRRDFQTVSATSAWPSAVGWMPSGWLSRASPATPSSRKGTSVAPFALASSG